MPFVALDVIKLDLRLVQAHTDREVASIAGAVRADAERRGARILSEGIETQEHLERALVLGATLGQGWLFGRPGPLGAAGPLVADPRSDRHSGGSEAVAVTPWSLVADWPTIRSTTKRSLMPMSHHVEEQATYGDAAVVLGAFQDSQHFTPRTRLRYEHLAQRNSLVGALGVAMAAEPALGVRGGRLPVDHPLHGEWTVTVVGPHVAVALIAKDRGTGGPEEDRQFDYVITHDRETVVAAARSLMQHLVPD